MSPGTPSDPGEPVRRTGSTAKVTLLEPEQDRAVTRAKVLDFPAPRRSHRVRNTVLGVLGVLLLLGGVVAYAVFSPALALRTVEVEGNSLVATSDVTAALAPLMGVSLTRITDDDVRARLEGMAPVADVRIAAQPPSTLVVTLREHLPVAVLRDGEDYVLIDAEGRQLAAVADRDDARLPLIDGGADAVNSAVFSSITAVLAELPPEILARLNSASAGSVDSIRLSLTGDQRIFWGSADRNAEKAAVLEALLAMPESDVPVGEFDVSTPDRPVTR